MLRALVAAALTAAVVTPAVAQQPDPAIAIYRQLLSEANDRVAAMGGHNASLDAKVKELTKALDEEKAKAAKLADKPGEK